MCPVFLSENDSTTQLHMAHSNLPLLLNPLLNAIFNNPDPKSTSHLHKIYKQLATGDHAILVPNVDMLLNYYDSDSGKAYNDLSYDENFIGSHIIKLAGVPGSTEFTKSGTVYLTLNSKQILVKRDALFTGKGFEESIRCRILRSTLFHNFNDYIPKGKEFPVLLLDRPLVGSPANKQPALARNPAQESVRHTTFQQLMKLFPFILTRMDGYFDNVATSSPTVDYQNWFRSLYNVGIEVLSDMPKNEIEAIFYYYPDVDLKQEFYEYLENIVHDKVWKVIVRDDNIAQGLENIDLQQVGHFPRDLKVICQVEKQIEKAVEKFQKLATVSTCREKGEVLVQTLQLVSTDTVDADNLVSLFVVVVCRSNVENLTAHIEYIDQMSYEGDTDHGLVGYAKSTLEAVLLYLVDSREALLNYSTTNLKLWNDLREGASVDPNLDYQTRTPQGESCLMLSLQNSHANVFEQLLQMEELFPLEDILYDKNLKGETLLSMAIQMERKDAVGYLYEILSNSCDEEECIAYCNTADGEGRIIGHYTFDCEALEVFGKWIDWKSRDVHLQTPILSIARKYDHPNYSSVFQTSFDQMLQWYNQQNMCFNLDDHVDSKGNTLLHILKSDIDVVLRQKFINVNKENDKGLTPLMTYVKYNRLENLEILLKDSRLNFDKTDKYGYRATDFVKNSIVDAQMGSKLRIKLTETGWKVYSDSETYSLKKLLEIVNEWEKKRPSSCVPVGIIRHRISTLGKLQTSTITRQQANLLADYTTKFFDVSKLWSNPKVYSLPGSQLTLSPDDVQNMFMFVQFTMKEMITLKAACDKMIKVIAFLKLKTQDLGTSRRLMFKSPTLIPDMPQWESLVRELQSEKDLSSEKTLHNVFWLSFHIEEMIQRLSHFTNVRVFKWWRLYGELVNLNRQITVIAETPALEVNEPAFMALTASTKFNHIEARQLLQPQRQVLEEIKLHRRQRGLFMNKTDHQESLQSQIKYFHGQLLYLNHEIKDTHESLAEEVSRFMTFKSEFLAIIVKEYTHHRLINLRFTSMVLDKHIQ